MRKLIGGLSVAAAVGLATPAFAQPATLDAILFSSVSVAKMTPQMERSEFLFNAKWCALLVKNATKPVKTER